MSTAAGFRVSGGFLSLTGGDLHDRDGVPDHVGWALVTGGGFWHAQRRAYRAHAHGASGVRSETETLPVAGSVAR